MGISSGADRLANLLIGGVVAQKLAIGLVKRKREMILTFIGFMDVFLYKRFPKLMDWVQLKYIQKQEKTIDPIKK